MLWASLLALVAAPTARGIHTPLAGPVCTAVCLHIDASTPNFAIQELHVGDWERIQSIQKGEFILKDGCVDVPKLPGLGIDLDEKELAKYPFQPHDMAGMFDPAGDLQPD